MNPSLIVPPANEQHHPFERDLLTYQYISAYQYLSVGLGSQPVESQKPGIYILMHFKVVWARAERTEF